MSVVGGGPVSRFSEKPSGCAWLGAVQCTLLLYGLICLLVAMGGVEDIKLESFSSRLGQWSIAEMAEFLSFRKRRESAQIAFVCTHFESRFLGALTTPPPPWVMRAIIGHAEGSAFVLRHSRARDSKTHPDQVAITGV
jgi:hypothetical protein